MAYTLKKNAYHILGLDVSASERDILKRSKEITNRLRIDDCPSYDLDAGLFENFRNEDNVKDSLQRLQSPKKRIIEYFFWFQIADAIDEQVLGLLKAKDYLNAIRVWQKASQEKNTKALFYKKNLAVLYCLVLSKENDKQYLKESLGAWKELVDSDKFWTAFAKVYKLHDEQTASEEVVSDFKGHLVKYLSDIYTELHQIHNDAEYINEFQKIFSAKGEKIEKNVINPIYQSISENVEILEKMDIGKKGNGFGKKESDEIRNLIATIQEKLNSMIDMGLYEDSQTKIMRDRVANAIRIIVLDLHNNLSELDKAEKLLQVAIQIAGTGSLKNKLESEAQQIKKNISEGMGEALSIEIPGYGGGTAIFSDHYVEFKNRKIFYKDVTGVSYRAVNHSINMIPTSQNYDFSIETATDSMPFSFSSTLYIGNKNIKDTWTKLIGISKAIIEPVIIKKLIDRIFIRGETINIGEIEFSKEGYSKKKFRFFREAEKETVHWNESIYTPQYSSGNVVLFKEKDGKGRQWATMSMDVTNSVILPEFINECYNQSRVTKL